MRIGGMLRFSLIDYPEHLAAVLFTQGCPFRCDYCHNPALVLPQRYGPVLDEAVIWRFLAQRIGQLEAVVISGGEPTIHADLPQWIDRIRGLGYRVKLNTMGLAPHVLEGLLSAGKLDYVAMDIKAPLERYAEVVHYPVKAATLGQSIDLIMQSGVDYEFRTTVVQSQLSAADIQQIGAVLRGAKRYILQAFKPNQCLNPVFNQESSYSPEVLAQFARDLSADIPDCRVR